MQVVRPVESVMIDLHVDDFAGVDGSVLIVLGAVGVGAAGVAIAVAGACWESAACFAFRSARSFSSTFTLSSAFADAAALLSGGLRAFKTAFVISITSRR